MRAGLWVGAWALVSGWAGLGLAAAPGTSSLSREALGSGFRIEGKVLMPQDPGVPKNWQSYTRVLANYGQYIGLIRGDGSFVINDVPPGSYVVEVASRDYIFEPFRVDITSKGKMRGRKLNFLQPSAVAQVAYPLKFLARQPAQYFRKREELRLTDMLLNPMVLMMVLPLLLIAVVPKLINTEDPEIQREMQQSMQMPKVDMPDLSETLTNILGGGKPKAPKRPVQKPKRT